MMPQKDIREQDIFSLLELVGLNGPQTGSHRQIGHFSFLPATDATEHQGIKGSKFVVKTEQATCQKKTTSPRTFW